MDVVERFLQTLDQRGGAPLAGGGEAEERQSPTLTMILKLLPHLHQSDINAGLTQQEKQALVDIPVSDTAAADGRFHTPVEQRLQTVLEFQVRIIGPVERLVQDGVIPTPHTWPANTILVVVVNKELGNQQMECTLQSVLDLLMGSSDLTPDGEVRFWRQVHPQIQGTVFLEHYNLPLTLHATHLFVNRFDALMLLTAGVRFKLNLHRISNAEFQKKLALLQLERLPELSKQCTPSLERQAVVTPALMAACQAPASKETTA